ncbi:MAG TPA: hypothetical protein VMT63_06520 [Bacteroidales bacterium]|nr:hypothetical protein [Bacteroidales bacterium]
MKRYMTINKYWLLAGALVLLVLSGCAQRENVDLCLKGHQYGFFGGLWHGFIAPFDFVAMLFDQKITMYAQNNNGGLYALGFLLGSGGWGFFGGKGVRRVRHTRVNVSNGHFDHAEVVE